MASAITRTDNDLKMILNYSGHHNAILAVQVTDLSDAVFIRCSVNHAVIDDTSLWNFFNTFVDLQQRRCSELTEIRGSRLSPGQVGGAIEAKGTGKGGAVEMKELVAVSDAAWVFLGELGGFCFDEVSILFEFGDGILGVVDFKDADSELAWCHYRHKEKINLAGHEEYIDHRIGSASTGAAFPSPSLLLCVASTILSIRLSKTKGNASNEKNEYRDVGDGDQKYAQYSKIIRQPVAITTNQVMKGTTRTLLHATNQVIKNSRSDLRCSKTSGFVHQQKGRRCANLIPTKPAKVKVFETEKEKKRDEIDKRGKGMDFIQVLDDSEDERVNERQRTRVL
ncbi:hypothetical protein ACFX1S_019771 [Malus domestica]